MNDSTSHQDKSSPKKGKNDKISKMNDSTSHEVASELPQNVNRYVQLGMSHEYREGVGRAAKHLLDHGRLLYVREVGGMGRAALVTYVQREVTKENVALVIC